MRFSEYTESMQVGDEAGSSVKRAQALRRHIGSIPLWDSFLLAVIYVVTAKIGQTLAISPGNVTAVWIPSGIILAAILIRGYHLWPGVFLGAFLGNTSSYVSFDSATALVNSIAAGLMNGVGDVLCVVLAAYAIRRTCGTHFPFRRASHVLYFVFFGALLGSFVSAAFGVTGLATMGFIPWRDYSDVFMTWWTGDGVGVLVLTPLLLVLADNHDARPLTHEHLLYLLTLILGIAFGLGQLPPDPGHIGLFALLPISLWSVFRLEMRVTFASIFLISATLVLATAIGIGSFAMHDSGITLLELQQYISVLALTVLTVQGIKEELSEAQVAVIKLNQELDERVLARTADLQEARDQLEKSERRLRDLLDSVEAGVVVHGPDSKITYANPKATIMLGIDSDEMQGKVASDPAWHFVDAQQQRMAVEDYPVNRIIRTGESLSDMLIGIVKPSKETTWVLLNGEASVDTSGALKEIIISFVDITEIKEAQSRLIQAAAVFEHTIEGVTITSADGAIIDVNPAFTNITGYSREEVIGQHPRVLLSDKHDRDFFRVMWKSLKTAGYWRGEIWNRRKDGSIYPVLMAISSFQNELGLTQGYIGVFNDIARLKKSEEKLEHLAHHDALTGLPNRLLFTSHLEQSVKNAKRHGTSVALVFVDLDRFKSVNDSLGHHVGDALLEAIASRLSETVRDNDMIARISGDEFIVLLEDVADQENVLFAIERIMGAFEQVFTIEGNSLRITASLGVSLLPQDAADATELMKHSDAAMYLAKDEGRNTYRFFTPEINDAVLEHALLGNALSTALEQQEFHLLYQPQVDLRTGDIVGLETLLRWKHPTLGMIPPGRFIPIAEQSGWMRRIGNYVLQAACTQGRQWLDAGLAFGRIAVNVSGRQFQSGSYLSELQQTLKKTGLPADSLEIELTESILMKRTPENIALLGQISDLGICIAIDDFGTGYSSLSYLSKLPIDKLKVDREFIRDVLVDKNDAALAASIIAMGKALNLTVVAEGVELAQQSEFLKAHDCQLVQGYLFGRPAAADEIGRHLKKLQR